MSQATIKVNCKNAQELINVLKTPQTELGKRVGLRYPTQINVDGFWPNPHVNMSELKLNPEATKVTVYERDGSDYTINISSIKSICEFYNTCISKEYIPAE